MITSRRRLSSQVTVVAHFVPAIVGVVAIIGWLRGGTTVSEAALAAVASVLAQLVFRQFHVVNIDGDALIVSRYGRAERLPLAWIKSAEEHRGSKSTRISVTWTVRRVSEK